MNANIFYKRRGDIDKQIYLAFLEIKKKKILGTDEKGPSYIIFISISYRPSQEYYMKKLLLHVTFAAYHHHPSNM